VANFECIASTGRSLERLLNAGFQQVSPIEGENVRAVLIRTEDLETIGGPGTVINPPALSLYLYRVDFNKTTRAGWSAAGSMDGRAHLPLDLHFLLTPWAGDAENELKVLGRAMQILETYPSLTGPLLGSSGDWLPGDSVQLVLEEITTEAVMRTFDSLPHDYKLSIPYVARVVRLDALAAFPLPDVHEAVVGIVPAATP
jgi:hypothetical protein